MNVFVLVVALTLCFAACAKSDGPAVAGYPLPTFASQDQERRFFTIYALGAIGGKIVIPDAENTEVKRDGDFVTVTFPVPPRKDGRIVPGPSFVARVRIERKSGRVISIVCDAN